MTVIGLDPADIEYGFRLDGPYEPAAGHRFDAQQILLDPYAKAIGGLEKWGQAGSRNGIYPYRARPFVDDFDWEGDQQLNLPLEDLVIYEMHVRGFTADCSSAAAAPGTLSPALSRRFPTCSDLGVNCIELMPVFEFDELDNDNVDPETGQPLQNYWGYNPVALLRAQRPLSPPAPEPARLNSNSLSRPATSTASRSGWTWSSTIPPRAVRTDPTISYRGIDNSVYYLLKPDGSYQNFSGTGNTFNCNHPIVRVVLLDCLRYWVSEFHIDGFRFDLAASMVRDPKPA